MVSKFNTKFEYTKKYDKLTGYGSVLDTVELRMERTNGVLNDPFGVHVIVTSNGNGYSNMQMRILYKSF